MTMTMTLTLPAPREITRTPAHPLYPADQAFLWLPGFPGKERAYCSYNQACDIRDSYEERRDADGAFHAPVSPVNPHTYISWNNCVSPPTPFHAVPIKRPLSFREMEKLARQVAEVSGQVAKGRLLGVLRNENKTYILLFLSRLNLLAGPTPHRR